MEHAKYKASCPVCGRSLFRGSPNSYLEGNCPKCGSFLQIMIGKAGVRVVTGAVTAADRTEDAALHVR